jgi:hypothetical protein
MTMTTTMTLVVVAAAEVADGLLFSHHHPAAALHGDDNIRPFEDIFCKGARLGLSRRPSLLTWSFSSIESSMPPKVGSNDEE